MPGQEKVWTSLSDGSLMLSVFNFVFNLTASETSPLMSILVWPSCWCMLCCLILVIFNEQFLLLFQLFIWCQCVVFWSWCAVWFCFSTVKLGELSLLFYHHTFSKSVPWLQLLNVLFIFLSRHQPGSAALSGYQGNWDRVWSRLCPQHQQRLLTTSVRVRQRTGMYSDTHVYNHRLVDWVLIRVLKIQKGGDTTLKTLKTAG